MTKVSARQAKSVAATISHPKSRKAKQLNREIKKANHRKNAKRQNFMKLNLIGEKFLWFRNHIDKSLEECTPQLVHSLINDYLKRFDEELSEIKAIHAQYNHRKHASREDAITMTKSRETEEFTSCGLEVPDLLNKEQLKILKNWNGELRFLQNLKVVRYSKQDLLKKINQPS